MPDYDVIKKGEYVHPQKNNSIPVDNYIFIRENGKKYLLLSFNNTRKSLLTGLSLEITQLDSHSKEIGEKNVKYGNLSGKPKRKYVLTHKIEVADNCEDAIVNVAEALYGSYAYTVSGGREIIEYAAPAQKFNVAGAIDEMGWQNVSVSERTVKSRIAIGIFSCILIVLVLVLTFMQLKKFEVGRTTFHYNGVEYAFEDGDTSDGTNIYVVGYGARRSDITIPAEIEGHTVTKITKDSFKDNTRIRKLTIESDIPIEEGAFSGCKNLKTLDIENVKDIGKGAFKSCANLQTFTSVNLASVGEGAFENCMSLSSVDISHDTQQVTFANSVFSGCTSLTTVKIAQTIVYPDDGLLFGGCNNIKELRLKNFENIVDGGSGKTLISLFGTAEDCGTKLQLQSVAIDNLEIISDNFLQLTPVETFTVGDLKTDVVGNGAFDGTKLTTIKLPVSVTEVGDYAFRNAPLTEFDESLLVYAGDYAFCGTALSEFDGASLAHIGDYAFSGCASLNSFMFGNCTYLGVGAFADCTALTGISYPQSLNYVPEGVFSGCTALSNLTLTNGRIISVGANAFAGCTALKSVVVPNSVTSIGQGAFADTLLESISVPFIGGSATQNTFLGYIFGSATHYVNSFPTTLHSVTLTLANTIPENALSGCSSLTKINFPENLNSIGYSAFANCTSLAGITIPDSVISIGKGAFSGCSGLKKISLPFAGGSATENTFFGYLFGANNAMESQRYVPASLENVTVTNANNLYEMAFGSCIYIKNVDLTPSKNLVSLGENCFSNCISLKQVSLPESLTRISSGAFFNCINLSELTIPARVSSLGNNVFTQCFKLYEIWNLSSIPNMNILAPNCLKIHNSIDSNLDKEYINGYVIAEAGGEHYLLFYPEGELNVSLPATAYNYRLPNHLFFADAALKSVTVPSCVCDVGIYTFNNCTSLNRVTFAKDCPIGKIGEYMFNGCVELASAILPDSVSTIGKNAFYECAKLKTAEFGSELKEIGDSAFYNCKNLTSAPLNEGLTNIGKSAFENCASLTEVIIPSTLTSLGSRAFAGCKGITKLGIKSGLTAIESDTFFDNNKLSEVTLADSIRTIGDRAFQNSCIKELTLPRGVVSIGESAFASNGVLRSVVIPDSLTDIGTNAFYGCNRLYLVYNLGSLYIVPNSYGYGAVAQKALAVATSLFDAEYADVDGVTYLRHNTDWRAVWCDENATNLELKPFTHNGVEVTSFSILDRAFAGNSNIKYVSVGSAVSSIGASAFENCTGIRSISFTDGNLASIGDSAFANCSNIDSVNLKLGNLKSIGRYAFADCGELSSVQLPESLTYLPEGIFNGDKNLKNFSVPASVTTIGEGALSGCSSLEGITLPDGLTYIGPYAFYGCQGIESVIIPQNVKTISEQAFGDCFNLFVVYNLSSLDITERNYNHGAVGYNAVKIFTDLNEKAYFATVDYNRFVLLDNAWYLFRNEVISNITYLPESFTYEGAKVTAYTLKNYAFNYINSIVIPKAVKSIQPYAFSANSYITTVYFGGTSDEWSELKPSTVRVFMLYEYTDCVHESMKWTYDSGGNVSTLIDAYGYNVAERKDATCTEDGYEIYKCPNCGHQYTTVLNKTGHKPATDYAVQPTCTQSGLTQGSHCRDCGEVFVAQQEIPATGHNFNDDGTCTACGAERE
ncbi:MAG: leucine-rich repeat domain-containing protein [Clostridia bacterium]|nr:leucine-rich repeat domain-containing protein [Clostridia bacterium]